MPRPSDQARRDRRRAEARLATGYGWPGRSSSDLRVRIAFVLVLVVFFAGIVALELAR